MAFVIAEPCIDHMDQSCVAACPVDCIAGDPAVDRKLYIDPDGCIECGACASACPNGAIFEGPDLPPEWAGYAWVDAAFFRDPRVARATVGELLSVAAR
jgi:ferredoxin